jgi:hypothetical protein
MSSQCTVQVLEPVMEQPAIGQCAGGSRKPRQQSDSKNAAHETPAGNEDEPAQPGRAPCLAGAFGLLFSI